MAGSFSLSIDCATSTGGSLPWGDHATRIVPDIPQRAWLAGPETRLWLAVVSDAQETAVRLGRGANLAGRCLRREAWRSRYQRDIEALRAWLTGDYPGSLSWIATNVGSATGLSDDGDAWVERVRSFCERAMQPSRRVQPTKIATQRGGESNSQIQEVGEEAQAGREALLTTAVRRNRSGSTAAPPAG